MAKTTPLPHVCCLWCHAPVVFIEKLPMTTAENLTVQVDRYDCSGPVRHTMLVMEALE